MIEEDFYEEWPEDLDVRAGPRMCAKCGAVRPLRDFERPLTKAQAAYRGFANTHLVYVTSKFCKDCQPAKYKPSQMTPKQIRRAAYNGRVSMTKARIDVEKRVAASYQKKREAVINRWHKAKASPWLHIRAQVADELQKVTRTLQYYTHHSKADYAPAMRAFLAEYAEVLRSMRAACTLRAKTATPFDGDRERTGWSDVLDILRVNPRVMLLLAAQLPDGVKIRVRPWMLMNEAVQPFAEKKED